MSEGVEDHPNFLRDLVLIASPLLGALIVAQIVLSNRLAAGFSLGPGPRTLDFLTPAFVSLLVVLALFYGLKRNGGQVARLVVAGIMAAGMISGLVLLRIWFEVSSTVSALFYVIAAPLAYLGLYFSFRAYSGSLSPKKTGLLVIGSATFLGSLMGTSFPLIFTIFLLVSLSVLDVLIVESDLLRKTVGRGKYDEIISATTLALEEHAIGLGDFLVYSMLAASSLRSGGVYLAGLTVALVLGGAIITSRIAKSRGRVPGLPIPIWLGLMPSLLGLIV